MWFYVQVTYEGQARKTAEGEQEQLKDKIGSKTNEWMCKRKGGSQADLSTLAC